MRILLAAKRRSDIAAKWRKVIAMGISPWNIENTTRSPEGTKGTRAFAYPFAPSALRGSPVVRATEAMGSRPWLHRFVPSGLRSAPTSKKLALATDSADNMSLKSWWNNVRHGWPKSGRGRFNEKWHFFC